MRILFIPYGTDSAPATRYRVMQYLLYLKKENIDYFVFSAISKFSTSLMLHSPDFIPPVRFLYYVYIFSERLLRFLIILCISGRFDIIFLQRTTFPLRLSILLKARQKKIIFDIDDAIYLPDRQGNDFTTRIKRYVKKRELINMLKISSVVIVENEYIKKFVSQYCRNISKIPGPIDTERFFVRRKEKHNDVIIGWIGTPATTLYLHMLDNVFRKIKEKHNFVKFKFIGLGRYTNPDIIFERVKWSYETEISELQTFDIGIMPMPDNEWTKGKLGCKMLQYMAAGIPAVVSYTSTNAEIIENGIDGFFATGEDEWINILSRLIEDEKLRISIGENGRKTVLKKCSLSDNAGRLMRIFLEIYKKND